MFALGQPPVPCSPFLLVYCLGAFDLLLDHSFVALLAPDAASALCAIPADHTATLDLSMTGPLAALLVTHLNVQVRSLFWISFQY
jgi:hypothetical protein